MDASPKLILFDGVCNFCNFWVDFIIKRDRKHQFQFGTLQGNTAKEMIAGYGIAISKTDSVILVDNKKIYTHSSAAIRICKYLDGGWKLFYGLVIIPKFLRDPIYKWIARNRYKWFGKKESCRIPTAAERSRFIE